MTLQSGVYPVAKRNVAIDIPGNFVKPPDPASYREGDRIRMRTTVHDATAGNRTYRVTYVRKHERWSMLYAELMMYP